MSDEREIGTSAAPPKRRPWPEVVLSIGGLTLAVAGLLLLLVTRQLLSWNPLTIAIQVLAIVLWAWARRTFGLRSFHAAANPTAGGLVTTGPYRYWRHPIYDSILYFVWAAAISHAKLTALVGAVAVTAGLVARMLLEERLLRREYPEYADYCRRAKRFVPFLF